MSPQKVTSIWLVPNSEDGARIKHISDQLADAQKGARFQPHITLGSLTTSEPDLNAMFGAAPAVELKPIEIDRTDTFTMALFIRLEISPQLAELRAALESAKGFRASRTFDPHVSLCYGSPPEHLGLSVHFSELLDHPVRFNQIWAMEINVPVETHANVRTWRKIASIELNEVS
ncbi:MAG: hypothetical protein AAGL11_04410 [Pseudomonadota bacterium]